MNVTGIDPSLTGLALASYLPWRAASVAADLDHPHAAGLVDRELSSKPAVGMLGRLDRYAALCEAVVSHVAECDPRIVLIEGYAYGAQG